MALQHFGARHFAADHFASLMLSGTVVVVAAPLVTCSHFTLERATLSTHEAIAMATCTVALLSVSSEGDAVLLESADTTATLARTTDSPEVLEEDAESPGTIEVCK